MTGIIAIDECGNLGKNGTRFFVLSAVMSIRSRNLLHTAKQIGNKGYERKYKNTPRVETTDLLKMLAKSNASIAYVVIDKNDYNSPYHGIYGNDLYKIAMINLFSSIDVVSPAKEINILVDNTSSISQDDLEMLCNNLLNLRVKKRTKYNSSSNKCIQIADYVAGAIWHKYERDEIEHFSIIENMIRRP